MRDSIGSKIFHFSQVLKPFEQILLLMESRKKLKLCFEKKIPILRDREWARKRLIVQY